MATTHETITIDFDPRRLSDADIIHIGSLAQRTAELSGMLFAWLGLLATTEIARRRRERESEIPGEPALPEIDFSTWPDEQVYRSVIALRGIEQETTPYEVGELVTLLCDHFIAELGFRLIGDFANDDDR